MIIWRCNDRTHGGRVKVYPRALSEDWFFFFSVPWCLAAKAFRDGKNCNRLPSFFTPFFSLPLLKGIFRYISPSHWSWSSICWSCRSLLECLSHPSPSSTCYELQQTRWYYLGVISSLMRPDCQLRAFNAEVTASPRIAPPTCPHSCPTVLVLLFGTTGGAVFGSVLLSPSMTLVGQGQDGPWRWLPAAWAFLTHPWIFLLSRRGPWAWYEMGRACQIFRPHNSPSKSCYPALWTEMRVLMSSGPPNDLSSLILC